MSRYVRVTRFGGPEVLDVVDDIEPHAGVGQVRVRVHYAGLNPVDYKIFGSAERGAAMGVVPPYTGGNDYSGVVDQVGAGVEGVELGDAVFGGARHLAQADYVVVDADTVVHKPAGLSMQQAGGLDITGRTAWASVRALAPMPDDTVLVSAAAGGVGVLAAQLARRTGATVIGSASEGNHEFLRSLGVIPVAYGDGLVDRLRALAPQGITAVLDNDGAATIDAALELGVPGGRINTIAARAHRPDAGILGVGGADADNRDLAELARLIADGEIVFPIDSVFPLDEAREAYEHLMGRHIRGKVLLSTGADAEA